LAVVRVENCFRVLPTSKKPAKSERNGVFGDRKKSMQVAAMAAFIALHACCIDLLPLVDKAVTMHAWPYPCPRPTYQVSEPLAMFYTALSGAENDL